MPEQNARYLSTNPAQWEYEGLKASAALRRQANQNAHPAREIARRVLNMGSVSRRTQVLAQLLSPTGRVHIHHTTLRRTDCFPQSVCWRFAEVIE
jgi:hypothetical protein